MAGRNPFGINYERHPMIAPTWTKVEAMEAKIALLEKTFSAVLRKLELPVPTEFPLEDPDLPCGGGTSSSLEGDVLTDDAKDMETQVTLAEGPFSYQALDPEKSEIRLLVLWSAPEKASDIRAELMHVSLDAGECGDPQSMTIEDKRRYYALKNFTALSYTWGDAADEKFILVNGHQFPVTYSLDCALRGLRKTEQTPSKTYLWVDQICKANITYSDSTNFCRRHQSTRQWREGPAGMFDAAHIQKSLCRASMAGHRNKTQ